VAQTRRIALKRQIRLAVASQTRNLPHRVALIAFDQCYFGLKRFDLFAASLLVSYFSVAPKAYLEFSLTTWLSTAKKSEDLLEAMPCADCF
jgi:hypothetical protein